MGAQELISLKGSMLKEITNQNATVKIIADYLANRQRMRHWTDINRLMTELKHDGHRIDDKAFMEFWEKTMPAKGLGIVAYGRKMKDGTVTNDRFGWHYNLKEIGKSMLSGEDVKLVKVTKPFDTQEYPEVPERQKVVVKLRKSTKNVFVSSQEEIAETKQEETLEITKKNKAEKHVFIFLPSGKKLSLYLDVADTKALFLALTELTTK